MRSCCVLVSCSAFPRSLPAVSLPVLLGSVLVLTVGMVIHFVGSRILSSAPSAAAYLSISFSTASAPCRYEVVVCYGYRVWCSGGFASHCHLFYSFPPCKHCLGPIVMYLSLRVLSMQRYLPPAGMVRSFPVSLTESVLRRVFTVVGEDSSTSSGGGGGSKKDAAVNKAQEAQSAPWWRCLSAR